MNAGPIRIKTTRPPPKSIPSNSRFGVVRYFIDKVYRDQFRWNLFKSTSFFLVSIIAAQTLCKMEILPVEPKHPELSY